MTSPSAIAPINRFILRDGSFEEVAPDAEIDSTDAIEWLHFDRSKPDARSYLESNPDIDPLVAQAMLAEETRPRCSRFRGGILLNLRGINLNPGMEQDELISVRMWITADRLITLRGVRLQAIAELIEELKAEQDVCSVHELVSRLSWHLTNHIGVSLNILNEELDTIEEDAGAGREDGLRERLSEARRQANLLRRYLAPQRDALTRWMERLQEAGHDSAREHARESYDAALRYVEDLDSYRDRAAIVQDELLTRLSDKLNRSMFFLAALSAFFLPLTFLTGLLGVNLAGIPFSEAGWSFGAMVAALAAMATIQFILFRRARWFG